MSGMGSSFPVSLTWCLSGEACLILKSLSVTGVFTCLKLSKLLFLPIIKSAT